MLECAAAIALQPNWRYAPTSLKDVRYAKSRQFRYPVIRKAVTVFGYACSALIALQPFLAEVDPCTQGAPDGYGAAVFATILLTGLSLACILPGISLSSAVHLFGLFHAVTLGIFINKVVPILVQTNFREVHICGGQFGTASYPEEYIYAPVLFIALFSILLSSGLGIYRWQRSITSRDFA